MKERGGRAVYLVEGKLEMARSDYARLAVKGCTDLSLGHALCRTMAEPAMERTLLWHALSCPCCHEGVVWAVKMLMREAVFPTKDGAGPEYQEERRRTLKQWRKAYREYLRHMGLPEFLEEDWYLALGKDAFDRDKPVV
jgi:hypothetical protein